MYAERIACRVPRIEIYHRGISIFSSVISENSEILRPNFVPYPIQIRNSKITHTFDPTKHKNLKNSLNKRRINHKKY